MNSPRSRRQQPQAHLVERLPPKRLAFRLDPPTIRALIPPHTCGAYILLDGETPIYVGRSDACLRTRLATHNHRGSATHVLWEIARTPKSAYLLEAYWFHRQDFHLNQIHPACPAGTFATCPFCDPRALNALQTALDHQPLHLNGTKP